MSDDSLKIAKRRSTLRHLVEDKLRELIATGHFSPGERLIERELCETLDVGRTSVREALRQLEAEGLIHTEPHRGPTVTRITRTEAAQLFKIRAVLEGFCGAEFAVHGTDEEHLAFRSAVNAFAEAARSGAETPVLVGLKSALYRIMIKGARNSYSEAMLMQLFNRISALRATTMTQPDRLPRSVGEILDICDAICQRQEERARQACIHHITESAKIALRVLEAAPEPGV